MPAYLPFTRVFMAMMVHALVAMTLSSAPAPADFSAFDQRAQNGESLNVVFLGGSLTWGAQATDPLQTSYRALVSRRLEERHPAARFRFWDAAIGGTGSQLAAFRLERDVLARKPDLVFLDFTVNDDPFAVPQADRLASYESLVRRLVAGGVPVLQMILPVKSDVQSKPRPRPLDAEHKAIARAYGLPTADAVALAQAKVAAGETTPDLLWDLPEDATHPGDAGYALYAEAAWETYKHAVAEKIVCRAPEKMLHADTYMSVNRARVSGLGAPPAGWHVGKPHRNAVAFDFVMSRWADDMTIAQGPQAAPLRLKIRGVNVLLFGDGTPRSGRYEVRVNGGQPTLYDMGVNAKNGNFRHVQFIARNLAPDTEHLVEITPLLTDGQELQLESVCVAGAPATVALAH